MCIDNTVVLRSLVFYTMQSTVQTTSSPRASAVYYLSYKAHWKESDIPINNNVPPIYFYLSNEADVGQLCSKINYGVAASLLEANGDQ